MSTPINQVPTCEPQIPAIAPLPNYQPDSWLYTRATLGWLFDPKLNHQLPWLYQLFSVYCKSYFSLTNQSDLMGGRALFQLLAKVFKQWWPQRYLKFQLSDYQVFLDPIDARFFQVVNELTQSDADTQILASLLTAGDTFMDVGANHGSFAIVATKLVGAQGMVIAVEPQPRLAKAVEQSLAANALGAFQVYPVAVGDREGEIELLLPRGTSGSAGIYPAHSATHDYDVVNVPLKRFADLVAGQTFPGQTVLKLDIEGSEIAFLAGAKSLIMTLKPPLIIEIHPGTLKAAQTTGEELKQVLEDLGYTNYVEMHQLETKIAIAELNTNRQRNIVLFMS